MRFVELGALALSLAAKMVDGGGTMLVAQLEAKGGEVCIPLPQGLRPDEVRVIFDEESLGLLMEYWGVASSF